MTKRVSQLLKQLNVGLDTLNQELIRMQYPQVNLNTKLSDFDCAFLLDYFMSKEMTALTNAYLEVAKCRKELDGFFLHSFKPIEHLGEIEKMLYFKWITSNPQPIGFSGILLAKRQNSFYCTYFLHNRNVADTKSPYPIKRLEVIRWFNQKSMVFNQSLS